MFFFISFLKKKKKEFLFPLLNTNSCDLLELTVAPKGAKIVSDVSAFSCLLYVLQGYFFFLCAVLAKHFEVFEICENTPVKLC